MIFDEWAADFNVVADDDEGYFVIDKDHYCQDTDFLCKLVEEGRSNGASLSNYFTSDSSQYTWDDCHVTAIDWSNTNLTGELVIDEEAFDPLNSHFVALQKIDVSGNEGLTKIILTGFARFPEIICDEGVEIVRE